MPLSAQLSKLIGSGQESYYLVGLDQKGLNLPGVVRNMNYYEEVNIDIYDKTIACHPLIDACNASIAYRLLEHFGIPCAGKSVLDAGAGSGQMCRFLKGIPGLIIEAIDVDPTTEDYFRRHPELKDVPFHCVDILVEDIPKHYDAIISRGVYHHVPKTDRPRFIKTLCEHADLVIIADEGLSEYSTREERRRNCDGWYSFIIREARRREIVQLAELETEFWKHEYLETAEDGGDFKESPTHFIEDAGRVGLVPVSLDRIGPWKVGGGFFTATFITNPSS